MRSEYVSAECRKEKCALTLYRGFVLQDFYDMWGHLASGTFAACRKSLPAYGLALLEKVASRLCLLLHFGSSRLDVGETCCGGSARHASTMVFDSMKVQRCLGLKWYDALKALYTSEVLQRLSMMKCEENFYTKFHVISSGFLGTQCPDKQVALYTDAAHKNELALQTIFEALCERPATLEEYPKNSTLISSTETPKKGMAWYARPAQCQGERLSNLTREAVEAKQETRWWKEQVQDAARRAAECHRSAWMPLNDAQFLALVKSLAQELPSAFPSRCRLAIEELSEKGTERGKDLPPDLCKAVLTFVCSVASPRLRELQFPCLELLGRAGLAVRAYEEDASKADVQAFFFKLLKKEAKTQPAFKPRVMVFLLQYLLRWLQSSNALKSLSKEGAFKPEVITSLLEALASEMGKCLRWQQKWQLKATRALRKVLATTREVAMPWALAYLKKMGVGRLQAKSSQDPPALLVAAVTTSEGVDRAALVELYTKHVLEAKKPLAEFSLAAWGPAVTAASAEDGGLSRAAQFSRCDKRYLALQEFEKQLLPTAMRMMKRQPAASATSFPSMVSSAKLDLSSQAKELLELAPEKLKDKEKRLAGRQLVRDVVAKSADLTALVAVAESWAELAKKAGKIDEKQATLQALAELLACTDKRRKSPPLVGAMDEKKHGPSFSMETLKDPEKLKAYMMKYSQSEAFKIWAGFAVIAFIVFMLVSSGDFSFLLTLSSLLSTFSFLMVALKMEIGRSCKGVSLKMMECYLVIFFFRLCAIIPFEGYLPFDKSGDWFYQTCEALGFCLAGTMVYFCRVKYAASYNPETDTFQHLYLGVGALGLSLIFHPNLNGFLPSDMGWAFALYLESVAVLCQLFMFMKEGRAQEHTSHFLAAQALAKVMSFIFWAACMLIAFEFTLSMT
eukprot:s2877_g1.t1